MCQENSEKNQEHRDFFIRYTICDQAWAKWIGLQFKEAGSTFFIQAWDFRPGMNFVAGMDHTSKQADRTVLVLSPAYLESDDAFSEWAVAFRHDLRGTYRRVLPMRIEPCNPQGVLGPLLYIDLSAWMRRNLANSSSQESNKSEPNQHLFLFPFIIQSISKSSTPSGKHKKGHPYAADHRPVFSCQSAKHSTACYR
jgi:TIR domain